jgi:hypothetical protein
MRQKPIARGRQAPHDSETDAAAASGYQHNCHDVSLALAFRAHRLVMIAGLVR